MAQDVSLFQLGTASNTYSSKAQADEITQTLDTHHHANGHHGHHDHPRTEQDGNVIRLSHLDENRLDHFIHKDGLCYAGTHLIVDLWGASKLDDIDHIKQALMDCVEEAGATLLHIHLHHFSPNGGVSGVAVLAESHISIHTWPEVDYAALDIFMCGDAKPHAAIPVLKRAFTPDQVQLGDHKRGLTG